MRTKNSILNIITGFGSQIVMIILGFVSRKVFIDTLGLQILGINGLLTNVIAMLSLAELGIGSAIYYSLYKPLAEKDYIQTKAIMQLYEKMYRIVALVVAVFGLSMLPFVGYIIKDSSVDMNYVRIVTLVFLANSVSSYLLAYKQNIISADQKSYIITSVKTIFNIVITIAQIIIIIKTQNYILFLAVKLVLDVCFNFIMRNVANKRYPYLKDKSIAVLKPEIKADIIKNIKALFIVNISSYCVFGTDNIIISSFVSITAVGLFSNYTLFINILSGLISQVFRGFKASFGNYLINEGKDNSYFLLNVMSFLNFWVVGFCSISLCVLINPFLNLWLGEGKTFPILTVILIVSNFYFRNMTQSIEVVRNSAGLYSPYPFFKYWALIEGVLNLILGLAFCGLFNMGINGVLLATTISTQISVFVLPWNVYKYVFNASSKEYYVKLAAYFASTIIIGIITVTICNFVVLNNKLTHFLIQTLLCITIPNGLIFICFYKMKEFEYLWKKRTQFKLIALNKK